MTIVYGTLFAIWVLTLISFFVHDAFLKKTDLAPKKEAEPEIDVSDIAEDIKPIEVNVEPAEPKEQPYEPHGYEQEAENGSQVHEAAQEKAEAEQSHEEAISQGESSHPTEEASATDTPATDTSESTVIESLNPEEDDDIPFGDTSYADGMLVEDLYHDLEENGDNIDALDAIVINMTTENQDDND